MKRVEMARHPYYVVAGEEVLEKHYLKLYNIKRYDYIPVNNFAPSDLFFPTLMAFHDVLVVRLISDPNSYSRHYVFVLVFQAHSADNTLIQFRMNTLQSATCARNRNRYC